MVDFRVEGTASLEPDRIIESVDQIIEKLDSLKEKIDDLDVSIDRLSGKSIDIGVNIDGEDKLIFLRDLLDDLDSRIYHVRIATNISGAEKLDELQLKLDAMDADKHTVRMDIDLKGAAGATSELLALDEELNNKEKDFDKAKKSSDGFNFSLMMLAPLLTAVIPILASAGGGAVALAGAFAAMAPGLLGIELAAKPAFTAIQQLSKTLDANTKAALANTQNYDQINKILTKNSAAFRSMNPELQGLTISWYQLQGAYSAFQKAVDPAVFPLIGSGLDLMRQFLSGLPALTMPASAALQGMLIDFSNRLHDPTFKSFFNDMKKNTYQLVSDWSEGVLNIIEGIAAMLHAFMPLSLDVSDGFLKMSQSFDKWAQGLSKSKGFQEFVTYVKTNGPIVLDVIKQLAILLANVGSALSGMGSGSLDAIDKLLKSLNNLDKTNPGLFKMAANIGLIGLAAAKFAPLVGPLLEFLATPVGAVVLVLAGVAAGFVYAYNHSKEFHDWVVKNLLPMWNQIVDSAKQFVDWAKGLWPDLLQIWDKYGKSFLALVKNVWNLVGNIFQGALKIIEGIVDVFVGLFTGNWKKMAKGLGEIAEGIWKIVKSIFTDGVKAVLDIFAGLGEALYNIGKAIIQGLWNGMKYVWDKLSGWNKSLGGLIHKGLDNLGNLLYDIGKSIIQGLWNGMKSLWNDVTGWVSGLGNIISNLKGPIEKDRTLLTPHGKVIMQGLMAGMQSQLPALVGQLQGFGKTIENSFGNQYTTDISARIKASLGSADYNMANYQQGGRLPSASAGTQYSFNQGSIVINNPREEQPSQTLTRLLQGAAAFGTVQAPFGMQTGVR